MPGRPFRSEEHVRNWSQFNRDTSEGIIPLADLVMLFSTEGRKHLQDGDHISRWQPLRVQERVEVLKRLGKTGPFWLAEGWLAVQRTVHRTNAE